MRWANRCSPSEWTQVTHDVVAPWVLASDERATAGFKTAFSSILNHEKRLKEEVMSDDLLPGTGKSARTIAQIARSFQGTNRQCYIRPLVSDCWCSTKRRGAPFGRRQQQNMSSNKTTPDTTRQHGRPHGGSSYELVDSP